MTLTKLKLKHKCLLNINERVSFLICSTIAVICIFSISHTTCQINSNISSTSARNDLEICVGYINPDVENLAYVCGVIVAEAGYDYTNQCLVAQCILNGAIDGNRSLYATTLVGYTYPSSDWASGQKALNDVLNGYRVTNEKIKYFYAPALCQSDWHESQDFVLEYGGHRYFKEAT